MINLAEAVIVEGKYDKIKLSNFIDAEIIVTDGFRIFKDKQKCDMIRRIAEKRGIIILTDSDSAGFMIRGHIAGLCDPQYIKNVFVPEIKGKEKRKAQSSAQGLLGVEGLSEQVITEALLKAGVSVDGKASKKAKGGITRSDLYEYGLIGGENSSEKRKSLEKKLDLPTGMSVSQLLTALNSLFDREELEFVLGEPE
jgi:ribonuclease M5